VPAFLVKLGANDLNCVDVPLNPTHSLFRWKSHRHFIATSGTAIQVITAIKS